MAAYNKFNSLVAALANKVHNLSADQLKVALTASANPPVAGNTKLSDLTEIAYTNLSTRSITTISSTQSGGVYKLLLTDLTITASGGSAAAFQYVVIYNDTATNKELLGWYDRGAATTLLDADFLVVDFDGVNGLFDLT